MKTLKQIMEECANEDNWCNIGIETAINCFKEWLQQKLYPDPKKYELEYTHNITINELLEELEKETKQT